MTYSDAIHLADLLGDWTCVSWQGRVLPAAVGGSLMVGGDLSLRSDGSFCLTRFEVAPGDGDAHAGPERPISCVHAYEGSFDVEQWRRAEGCLATRLRLHVATHVLTTLRYDHTDTAMVAGDRDFEVAADAPGEVRVRVAGAEAGAVSRFTR